THYNPRTMHANSRLSPLAKLTIGQASFRNLEQRLSAYRLVKDQIVLERQIVVLVLERPGELLEVLASSRPCCRSCFCLGPGGTRGTRAIRACVATTTWRSEHDQLANIDLRGVLGLAILVLPLPVLDTAFDIELVTFLDVPLHDVGKLRVLRIPNDAAMPICLLLLRSPGVVPRPAGCEREV